MPTRIPKSAQVISEWRVATYHARLIDGKPGHESEPLIIECTNEAFADKVATLERIDYPHARVEVQTRNVSPWETKA